MSEPSELSRPIDQKSDDLRLPDRRQPSVLGLSIVSGLNVICLAFITYHFAAHADDPVTAPTDPHAARETMEAALPPTMATSPPAEATLTRRADDSVSGNIDLVQASRHVLDIAAGIDKDDAQTFDQLSAVAKTPGSAKKTDAAPPKKAAAKPAQSSHHWVQLGALSAELTARRYWASLSTRYAAIIGDRTPHVFGPTEVGGSLYHIRIGPMPSEAAASLCRRLKAQGADCFCLGPVPQDTS